MNSQWDVIISSLQDICNNDKSNSFDHEFDPEKLNFHSMDIDQLQQYMLKFQEHRDNLSLTKRLILTTTDNLKLLIEYASNNSNSTRSNSVELDRVGRSFWSSNYNPSEPIYVGSEVAYKSRKGLGVEGEWIQCEVMKISSDGTKFEVRDPEPDDSGKPGGIFKCNWKEILLIPPNNSTKYQIPNYPNSTKVLARYPETTTFYPAIVIGSKRDGTCKLRFDGEEEVDKETEVDRRLVLPYPSRK